MNRAWSRTAGVTTSLAVLALTLAGCGGDSSDGQPAPVPTKLIKAAQSALAGGLSGTGNSGGGSPAAPGATGPHVPTPSSAPPQKIDIGKTVYYGGFKITLKTLTFAPGQGMLGGEATFDAQFANEGTDATSFGNDVPLDLAVGDNHYKIDNLESDFPQVPGKAQGEGTFGFIVDKTFVPAKATLTIGDAGHAQAVVPLGDGTLTTLAPVAVQVSPTKITAGLLTITLRSAQLRADLPAMHRQMDAGKRELLVTFDAAMGKIGAGGFALIGSEVFSLKLPDGNSVTVDPGEAVNETLDQNTSKSGLETAFTVDAPADGNYQVTITGKRADLSDVMSKPTTFSITGAA